MLDQSGDLYQPELIISQQRKSYLDGHSVTLSSYNSFMFVYHISLSVILFGVHVGLWLLGCLLLLAIYLVLSSPLEHQ